MKKQIFSFAVLIGLAVAVWMGWKHWHNDERKIRALLHAFSEDVSFKPDDSTFAKMGYVDRVAGYFSPDVVINSEIADGEARGGISSRAELRPALTVLRMNSSFLEVKFFDMLVKVAPDKETATAYMTARGKWQRMKEAYAIEVRSQLKKIDGNWVVSQMDLLPTIQ